MYGRHDLIWLSAAGWETACAQQPEHAEALRAWARQGWPATVRRGEPDVGEDMVCLGVTLPRTAGCKTRVGLCVPRAQVVRASPPLPLDALPADLPAAWRPHLPAFLAAASGLPLRLYGSASLQALTGRPYLNDASDLDLLLYPDSPAQLDAALGVLATHAAHLPLDGEIVFPSGAAVAWKEWCMAQDGRVLVKDLGGVRLERMDALLAGVPA
jgi:phosphoribosyl-dephospho-CoA transferase